MSAYVNTDMHVHLSNDLGKEISDPEDEIPFPPRAALIKDLGFRRISTRGGRETGLLLLVPGGVPPESQCISADAVRDISG